MSEPNLKRFKPNTEEGKLTELRIPGCKMSLARHQYLQVESLSGKIKISGENALIQQLQRKLREELSLNSTSSCKTANCSIITIQPYATSQIKNDHHELLKMGIIQCLTEDGFEIISTVFDPSREGKGAEKHMMCKAFQQPTNHSGTDQASGNKASS